MSNNTDHSNVPGAGRTSRSPLHDEPNGTRMVAAVGRCSAEVGAEAGSRSI